MCWRFFLFDGTETVQASFPQVVFPGMPDVLPPRYNIAPGQPVAVMLTKGWQATSGMKKPRCMAKRRRSIFMTI